MNESGFVGPAPREEGPSNDKKVAYIVSGIWGVLVLLLCCGGALVTMAAGYGSESDGMAASMAAISPACCSLGGFATTLLGLFGVVRHTAIRIGAPIAVGILSAIFGGLGLFVFYQVIWPSL